MHAVEKQEFIAAAKNQGNEWESSEEIDRYTKLQSKERPTVDDYFFRTKIEQLWNFTEQDGTMVSRWYQGVVITIKKSNRVHVEWNNNCVYKREPKVTEEKFLISK